MHPRNCRGLKGVRNAVIGRAESLKHVSKLGIASCLFLLKFRTQGLAVADFSHFTMEWTRMHPPLTPLSLRKPTLEPNNSSATFCILLLWNLKAGRLVPAFGYIQCYAQTRYPHQSSLSQPMVTVSERTKCETGLVAKCWPFSLPAFQPSSEVPRVLSSDLPGMADGLPRCGLGLQSLDHVSSGLPSAWSESVNARKAKHPFLLPRFGVHVCPPFPQDNHMCDAVIVPRGLPEQTECSDVVEAEEIVV